jgi:hypothetical protein
MSINLSRNTRLWISTEASGGTHTNANTFEIPVQEGYSLSQSVSTTDVSVEEAGPTPSRGSKRFNSALDPVDWSFSTYTTPYKDATVHYMVDMLLWHALSNGNAIPVDLDNSTTSSEVYGDASSFNVGFMNNSAHVLKELYFYFLIDNKMYYVDKAQVSQVEMSVDISDIGQSAWSGQGLTYTPITTPSFVAAGGFDFDEVAPEASGYVKVAANKTYLVNKLTLMSMTSDMSPTNSPNNNYNIPLTGASITINNNVTYLTPTTLAEVDKPIGSFTGAFEVTGSIDAYLREITGATGSTASAYGSADLLAHMLTNVGTSVANSANLVFKIGGGTGPRAVITIPTAHLSVPDISIDDVVSTSIEFKGIPTSTELASGDEISFAFFAE